ncbi:MAG: site-specific integrase, partial [Actinomycetota bacterium]
MPPDLPPAELALIGAFADHLALERHLSPNTVTAYRRDLAQLATFLHRDRSSLAGATYPLLRRFLAQQHTRGYARASIARKVGAIHTFYRWATAEGRVADDPSVLLGRPKVVSRLPTVLRPREAAELAEAPPDP